MRTTNHVKLFNITLSQNREPMQLDRSEVSRFDRLFLKDADDVGIEQLQHESSAEHFSLAKHCSKRSL